jgi:hypothetical protein
MGFRPLSCVLFWDRFGVMVAGRDGLNCDTRPEACHPRSGVTPAKFGAGSLSIDALLTARFAARAAQ